MSGRANLELASLYHFKVGFFKIVRAFVCLLGVAAMLFVTVYPAAACECWDPIAPTVALARADAVFRGQVIAISNATSVTPGTAPDFAFTTFQVNTVWKGIGTSPLLKITSTMSGITCGFGFQPGREYLVYANTVNGELFTSVCYRTTPIANAQADLAVLGAGQAVTNGAALPDVWQTSACIVGLLAIVVIFGSGVFILRKRSVT